MPSLLPISTILQISDISQYLAAADIQKGNSFKSGVLAPPLALQIFNAKTIVRWIFNLNPNDPSLIQTSNYLYQLLGSYAIKAQQILANTQAGNPVITGPTNQSVTVGNSATFSVSVSGGASPLSYQWYDNSGNPIPGATSASYVFPNAQLTDNDKYFYVKVTDAHGAQAVSGLAFLTVTAALVVFYYFGDTDYSSDLNSGIDNVPYVGTFPYTPGQPLSFTWPSGAALNKYIVVKYPDTETIKTQYSNAPLNNGIIPSIAYDNIVTFNGFRRIFSRQGNPFSMNTSAPLIFS